MVKLILLLLLVKPLLWRLLPYRVLLLLLLPEAKIRLGAAAVLLICLRAPDACRAGVLMMMAIRTVFCIQQVLDSGCTASHTAACRLSSQRAL
jgi:hypothetical protein